jgi:hypothetical protein
MRHATPAEVQAWRALAEAHGVRDGELGRGVVELIDGEPWFRLITPLRADPYTDDLKQKVPPICFDRTLDGVLRLPGRQWAHVYEEISRREGVADEVRALAARLAREVALPATRLPPPVDTVLVVADGPQGRRIEYEALPPGTRLPIPLPVDWVKDSEHPA